MYLTPPPLKFDHSAHRTAPCGVVVLPRPDLGVSRHRQCHLVWGGLFVATYVAYNNGDIGASFENSAGTLFISWNDQYGVAQCPGQPRRSSRAIFAVLASC